MIVHDFPLPPGGCDPAELHAQVKAAVPALAGSRTAGSVFHAEFEVEQGPEVLGIIGGIVGAHAGPPAPLRLLAFLPASERERDHRTVDYRAGVTRALWRKLTVMYRGEVREVCYYDPDDHTKLVLKVVISYNRAPNGLVLSRTTTRTWYRTDGTAHPGAKITVKDYTQHPVHQMQEGTRRRQNVIDTLAIEVLGMLAAVRTAGDLAAAEALGAAFMALHHAAITTYVRSGDNAGLRAAVMADAATAWLDDDLAPAGAPGVTIRQAIYGALAGIMDS